MPFGNCNLKSADADRLRLTILITLALLPFAFVIYYFFAPEPDRPQLYHALSMRDEEQLARVHAVCENLPKPEKFELVRQSEHGSPDSSIVIYSYDSIRGEDEILPAFLIWFEENGWRRGADTLTFEKGKQKIFISVNSREFHSFPNQFEIYCSEKSN